MIAGVLGALCQLEVALQLVRENRSFRTVIGLVVLVLGGLIAAASLPDWHFEYLLQGEIIFQVGFAWCLIEWTYALADRMRNEQTLGFSLNCWCVVCVRLSNVANGAGSRESRMVHRVRCAEVWPP